MTETEWLTSGDPPAMLRWLDDTRAARGNLAGRYDGAAKRYDGGPSARKLRLYACACVRRVWHLLAGDKYREVVEARNGIEVAERYADGDAKAAEMDDAWEAMQKSARDVSATLSMGFATNTAINAVWAGMRYDEMNAAIQASMLADSAAQTGGERVAQAALLRDIVGNPFRPVEFRQQWRTPDVLSLARAAYGQSEADEECGECLGRGGRWEVNSDQWYYCPACDGEGSVRVMTDTRAADGALDPDRLAVLSDALEEAGCDGECRDCDGSGQAVDFYVLLQMLEQNPYVQRPMADYVVTLPKKKCPCNVGRKTHPLLAALRSHGPHYRGFWPLDLILGKE